MRKKKQARLLAKDSQRPTRRDEEKCERISELKEDSKIGSNYRVEFWQSKKIIILFIFT